MNSSLNNERKTVREGRTNKGIDKVVRKKKNCKETDEQTRGRTKENVIRRNYVS